MIDLAIKQQQQPTLHPGQHMLIFEAIGEIFVLPTCKVNLFTF